MKRIALGILAHVDSGKTTLSEAMLYTAGEIRRLGRVDHRDAFLDTNKIERERGITIFSKQAVINLPDAQITLLDTPGHVDFSAETERVLWALDAAILVISGSEGVQSHTETLWKLLKERAIPTFVFINKMDMDGTDRSKILSQLENTFKNGFVVFNNEGEDSFFEEAALCSEKLCNSYLENGTITSEEISDAIAQRKIFPCYFGSALRLDGVKELIEGIEKYATDTGSNPKLGARVFKISEDEKKNRLTHMKITGGVLRVRDKIQIGETEEKISEIRIYQGAKYKSVQEVYPGDVCCVCGISSLQGGMGIGFEQNSPELTLEPVFNYCVKLEDGVDPRVALAQLKKLEEEETQLRAQWNASLGEIHIQLMGEVQLEVLQRILAERFSLNVEFVQGSIVYKETIASAVEGVGHYEPLRHYAEVHLLLEPLKRGTGLVFESDCSEDLLSRNWQRLILTHLNEKRHIGTLTGSAVTDMKITLKSGKAHLKHTEGGDFRQATYRAVRHGLRMAEPVLLEPYYDFKLEVPTDSTGRAMTDLQQMGATLAAPDLSENMSVIRGSAPVSKIRSYQRSVTSYTRGLGKLSCSFKGYDKCVNPDEVIAQIGYNCDGDIENTADSVFCQHGAGFSVPWHQVTEYMHLDSIFKEKSETAPVRPIVRKSATVYDEDELMKIFERTYGKIVRKNHKAMRTPKDAAPPKKQRSIPQKEGPGYLLIDGYNVIFAWEELCKIASHSLEDARSMLIDRVCSYKALRPYEVILVFDAYKVKGNRGEIEKIHNITVVYTKEAQSADAYIEKAAYELGKKHHVQVATSDSLEQMIILGSGAVRISAAAFIKEMEEVQKEIETIIRDIETRSNML
ncbi:MAG: TetM/TetW/TetO/TetS family tetracycline resistance ribosomal protection protein [Clostridia bacterium]|nr:TetM/TetW/TetO/TetS family tetracycline resistance ribosomal protection protein [Clostridia bacterium]